MREYGKVRTAFWTDEKIVRMSDTAKLYALYLMTGPHTTMTGCFRLPEGYVAGDLSIAVEQVRMAEHELTQAGFMNRCDKTGFVFLPNFMRHNAIMNNNMGKAVAKTVWETPKDCAHIPALDHALQRFEDKLPKGFMKRFRERFSEALSNGSGAGSGNGSGTGSSNGMAIQEQEQNQEQDQEQEQKPDQNQNTARAHSSLPDATADESAAHEPAPKAGQGGNAGFAEDWFVDRDLPTGWPTDIETGDPLDPQAVLDMAAKGACERILAPAAMRLKSQLLSPIEAEDVPDIPSFMDRRPQAANA